MVKIGNGFDELYRGSRDKIRHSESHQLLIPDYFVTFGDS